MQHPHNLSFVPHLKALEMHERNYVYFPPIVNQLIMLNLSLCEIKKDTTLNSYVTAKKNIQTSSGLF